MSFRRQRRGAFSDEILQAKEISFWWRSFKSGDAHTKKKGDEIDDFVKVVVTVHPFR
jgi:hypothetical protein